MYYRQLIERHPIISDQITSQRLRIVLRELEQTLDRGVIGDVVEFGCYSGTTSLFIRRLLDTHPNAHNRSLYVYDSFEGLPAKTTSDSSTAGEQFQAGELRVGKKLLLQNFKKAGLREPRAHKAWFKDLAPNQLPDQIAFAFLDGDFYGSIMDSLKLVWPRLSSGGAIAIDDYGREALPGVERAVHDFFGGKANVRAEAGIALLHKLMQGRSNQ